MIHTPEHEILDSVKHLIEACKHSCDCILVVCYLQSEELGGSILTYLISIYNTMSLKFQGHIGY